MSDKKEKVEKEKKKAVKAEPVKKAPEVKKEAKKVPEKAPEKVLEKTPEKAPEVKKAPVEKPVAEPEKVEAEVTVVERPNKRGGAGIVIAILVTIIIFMGAFIALTTLGILKLNIPGLSPVATTESTTETAKPSADTKTETKPETKTEPTLVDNPNQRVKVNNATLFEVGNLEFYLPKKFEAASDNGKNGTYNFNLVNDSGWATATVKIETTTKTPAEYIKSYSSNLNVTNSSYKMNGVNWVEAENPSMLAYATTYGNQVYMIVLTIKIDSDATADAASMIAKTIYFKKLYQ